MPVVRGNVVIVGRGSQKVLAAKPDTLHVRFIGSRASRSEYIKQQEGITYEEALKKIEAIDKQRSHYLKHYYDADWGDPRRYHLVINTNLMSDEQAVNVIGAAVRQL